MVGLSLAATLLAIALVVGLLAWVGRDLRARDAPARVWWLVVACYAFAASVWLVAIRLPLPVVLAWLATIPAAVATVMPERLAATLGALGRGRGPLRSRRLRAQPSTGAHRTMARPIQGGARPAEVVHGDRPAAGTVHGRTSYVSTSRPAPPTSRGAAAPTAADNLEAPAPAPQEGSKRSLAIGRRRWPAGDLRLAVELLEDAARIPDLDDAARVRIEARLGRLDRFRESSTEELLALVREDVHARLVSEEPVLDPDPGRARRIGVLLDELDPNAGR